MVDVEKEDKIEIIIRPDFVLEIKNISVQDAVALSSLYNLSITVESNDRVVFPTSSYVDAKRLALEFGEFFDSPIRDIPRRIVTRLN